VWGLLTELTASDARLVINDFFGEVGVLQSPETEKTRFKLAIISAVDVELAVTNNYKVWVRLINVHATHLTSLDEVALKHE
jgi:hypothetical protein